MSKEICLPPTILFKHSLESAELPVEWKRANVSPLFKKGSRSLKSNYRPVSLTSQISNMMEAILKDSIDDHLQKYKLIKDSQHGFICGRSCLTNLLVFLEEVTKYLDEGHPVDVLYLDFSKAFDKVPHARPIKKLKAHGISQNVSRWIESWLSNRQQRVVLNGKESWWAQVLSGVLQGSVLGPILFIMYINDIDRTGS